MHVSLIPYSQLKLPRWAWIALVAIPVAAAAMSAVHTVKTKADALVTRVQADSVYVRRDSFAVYRAGNTWKDTALAQLWRACIREGKCS